MGAGEAICFLSDSARRLIEYLLEPLRHLLRCSARGSGVPWDGSGHGSHHHCPVAASAASELGRT